MLILLAGVGFFFLFIFYYFLFVSSRCFQAIFFVVKLIPFMF